MKKSKEQRDKDYINSVCGNSDNVMYDEEDIFYSTYDYTVENLRGNY